ncbi:FAD-dependent oxidoreductase [Anoxynatronum buryatiense]|uniref:FAD-dependent oxidoreductase n=1 Tax=Anoxynatronum buryatiense TaxID=489973 RepID=UPI003211CC64
MNIACLALKEQRGGAIGCESGYFFADACDADVTILEMRHDICIDSNDSQRKALIPRMNESEMKWFCHVQVQEINADGVTFTSPDSAADFAPADLTLYTCGSRSQDTIIANLYGTVPTFIVTGDARKARTVKEATYEGFCASMDIL